jgi:hypothetical protein
MTEELNRFRAFISLSRWKFASTYAKVAPHEYTVREWTYSEPAFEEFVMFIRKHGYKERFWRKEFTYFEIDGWHYWTMGNPLNETTVINRAKKEPK